LCGTACAALFLPGNKVHILLEGLVVHKISEYLKAYL
jgi:hypothetical protein